MERPVETFRLSKHFGPFKAVDDLTLSVEAGEVFGLLGSTGAGKSTAIRMLCGLLKPSGGSARVLGIDVAADPEGVKRCIGYMSQRFSLYDDLTVAQNLRFFGGVYSLRGEDLSTRAAQTLEMAGLLGLDHRLTATLSGGWKQRLALACALLHRPRVLFLDEPTGGADPISRRQFWEIIDRLSAEGVTILVSTHYLDEAEHCHRIALMHAGRLAALGSIPSLKQVFAGRAILEISCPRYLEALDALEGEPWVLEASAFGTRLHLVVGDAEKACLSARAILERQHNLPARVERIIPSLEDVFIHTIEAGPAAGGAP